MEIDSRSLEETKRAAEIIVSCLSETNLVCLYGEMGAGKTALVGQIAKVLGIKKKVISPTFVIQRQYNLTDGQKKKTIYHIDLYRLENKHEIDQLGLSELISDKNNLVIIEWAERLGEILPDKRVDVSISVVNKNCRKIKIRAI